MIELPSPPWTPDDTEAWLSEDGHALPDDFLWPHRDAKPDGSDNLQPVLPSYRLSKGYGFWLRTTPYFPGLFEEIHQILVHLEVLPADGRELAGILDERRRARGTQTGLAFEAAPTPDEIQAEIDQARKDRTQTDTNF
jgi:hypothetical protein